MSKFQLKINQPATEASLKLAELGLILIAISLVANWTWTLLLPSPKPIPPTMETPKNDITVTISSSHWFARDAKGSAIPINYNFKLVGVFAPHHKQGFAIIKTPDNKQHPVLVRQEVVPGLTLQHLGENFIEVGDPGNLKRIMIEAKEIQTPLLSEKNIKETKDSTPNKLPENVIKNFR